MVFRIPFKEEFLLRFGEKEDEAIYEVSGDIDR